MRSPTPVRASPASSAMRAGDIVFTSGGTEANNLAIKGIAIAGPRRRKPTAPGRARRHDADRARVDPRVGRVPRAGARLRGDPRAGRRARARSIRMPSPRALRDDTALVSIGYANNEVGTVQDVAAIAAVARERGIPLHVDAVQAAGWLSLSAAELGADAISIAGHKLGAPKGTGVLGGARPHPARAAAARRRAGARPPQRHRGRRRRRRASPPRSSSPRRSGSRHPPASARSATASSRACSTRVPRARLTGDPVHRLAGTASFTFAGTSGEAVLLELERRGVVSSSGSACAAGSDEPSHVLVAMGIAPEVAQTAVRFTFPHG